MDIASFLQRDCVLSALDVGSRKQALQRLTELAGLRLDIPTRSILSALMERERLGCTSVGDGYALPHAKMHEVENVHGFFAQLKTPLEFDAVDGRPVDLVFLLLAPTKASVDHLKALNSVSRLFSDVPLVRKLRKGLGADALYELLLSKDGRVV